MTYTTRSRVSALMAHSPEFTSTTTVTSGQVDVWIGDVEAELDSALAELGISVPVSAPSHFLGWLTKLATEGVAATVLKSWFQDAGGPNSEGAWAVYERRYRDGIKAIRDGRIPVDVSESPDLGISSFELLHPDGVSAGDFGSGSDPMFSRDMDW